MSTTKVFVYGTLMRGEANHRVLGTCAELGYKGQARVLGAQLFDLGPYPAAVLTHDTTDEIYGELYSVTPETLRRLDRLEGVPDLYQRVKVQASGHTAYMYVMLDCLPRRAQKLHLGDWRLR